jgi:MFS transporter, DHA1 family, tetracycline resistance protein
MTDIVNNPRRILTILFCTLLLDMVGVGMLIPIIPSLFTDATSPSFLLDGFSITEQFLVAGLITAIFSFTQLIAAPILGELSDMFGRKKLLTLGVGMLALSQLLFAVGIAFTSIAVLIFARALGGIAGANFSIAQAVIADVTPPEKRAQNFGLIGAAFGVGFVLGPLLGGVLAGATGNPAVPFIFAGILGIFNVLSITLFLPETNHHRTPKGKVSLLKAGHNIKAAFKDKEVRPIYAVSFLVMLGFGFYTSFSSIYLTERFSFSESEVGTYFAVVGIWIIVAQLVLVRYLAARYSSRTLLLSAAPILSLCIFLYPFIPSVLLLYIIIPFIAGSFGLISTAIPALVSQGADKDKQGAALGINGSLQALSQGTAPLLAGLGAGFFSISLPFFTGTILILLAFLIVWNFTKSVVKVG